MNIAKCVENISKLTDLKRAASAYVIDYRGLSEAEIKEAFIKTAPQYYFEDNIRKAWEGINLHTNRNVRVIGPYLLQHVVLQKDECMNAQKATDEAIIKWEQGIVDRSNEALLKKTSERTRDLEFMEFVLDAAWEHNNDLSVDENNLIEKIRERIRVTPTDTFTAGN